MKSKQIISTITLAFLLSSLTFAQHDPVELGLKAITKEALKGQLDFLASNWMEGRQTATKGEFLAGDYIASIFQLYGLQPGGDMGRGKYIRSVNGQPARSLPPEREFFQKIQFIQTLEDNSSIELISQKGELETKIHLTYGNGYYLFDGPTNIEITSPIVFIGYGYKNDEIGYDDFKGLDLKGKIVLRVSGYPGMRDTLSTAYKKLGINTKDRLSFNRNLRQVKDELLKEYDVAAVIDASFSGLYGYRISYANYPLRAERDQYEFDIDFDEEYFPYGLPYDPEKSETPRISLSSTIYNEIIEESGLDINEFHETAANKLKSGSKVLESHKIHWTSLKKTQNILGRNVLAMIEGENPDEVIVVGAHYDHLGKYKGMIYNGSDDNASGTVGVMTMARAFAATGVKPKKTIIFAAWTGEEDGLLGSQYFVDNYPNKETLVLNLNFDMISRRPEQDTSGFKADMDYTMAFPVLKDLVAKANKKYDLDLEIDFKPADMPRGGTDFAHFAINSIPIYSFNAAFTSDYHGIKDHSEKANFDLMQKIIQAGFISLFELAITEGKLEAVKLE